jgi:hypothetical protein
MRILDRGSLSAGGEGPDGAVDQFRGVGLAALKTGEDQGAVGRYLGTRGLGDAVGLGDQQRRLAELSTEHERLRHHVDADREDSQRAGLARKLNPPRRNGKARLVIPHHHGCGGREPPPAKNLLGRDAGAGEACRRPFEDGRRRGAPVAERPREPLEQEIRRARGTGPAQRGQSFARDVVQAARARQPPGEQRRAPRVEVGLTGELGIERVEGLGGPKEQRRRFAAAALRVPGLGAQQVQAGALKLVQRTTLCCRDQAARHVNRARPQAGLGGGKRSLSAPRRVVGQGNRPLQKRGRRGQPAALFRPPGGALEL